MTATLYGWVILGVPLLLLGLYFFWRRWRTVFWMYAGAILLGFGYLTATGAMHEIGSIAVDEKSAATEPAADTSTTPEPAPAPDGATAPAQ